jgi:hypothetical protein
MIGPPRKPADDTPAAAAHASALVIQETTDRGELFVYIFNPCHDFGAEYEA